MSEHDYPAQTIPVEGEQPAEPDEQDGDDEQADADAAAQDEDEAAAE